MDALHPRLLVSDFGAAFAFYDAVLCEIVGATRSNGTAAGPYASWDVDGEGVLALFDRDLMAATVEVRGPGGSGDLADGIMFVCRVPDVDHALEICRQHGAEVVTPPTDRPHWGPNLRTAHLRDPAGTLVELQSY